MNAIGCILWQEVRQSDDPNENLLFVLADSFGSEGRAALHTIPIKSVTGLGITNWSPQVVNDVTHDDRVYTRDGFLERFGVHAFCSIPVSYQAGDDQAASSDSPPLAGGDRGAMNIYRNSTKPFTPEDMVQAEEFAAIVPTLLRAIRNDAGVNLIGRINGILHRVEAQSPRDPLPDSEVGGLLDELCKEMMSAFHCLEATIFIADHPRNIDECRVATTWSDGLLLRGDDTLTEALTQRVFTTAEPLLVPDLAIFDAAGVGLGLDGKTAVPDSIKEAVRRALEGDRVDELPRLSLMAVPLALGESVHGLIRCRIAREGPYFFTRCDLDHLTVVAAQIARYWVTRLAKREMHQELTSWRNFVRSVGMLNNFVRRELSSDNPDTSQIFSQALRLTGEVITDGEIMDVRLLDESRQNLYFAVWAGSAWAEGSEEEIKARHSKVYPVNDRNRMSAGAWVIQKGRVREMANVHADLYYDETFPNTRSMIIAPISLADERFGVLDIRAIGDRGFPPYARDIARLLGRQLGLYSFLARTITTLRDRESQLTESLAKLTKMQDEQISIFQDLTHQFKTPINTAVQTITLLLDDFEDLDEELDMRLQAVRGLCRKAERVSYNTELFTALAKGTPIPTKVGALTFDSLLAFLYQAAEDHTVINAKRAISFVVDEKSFSERQARFKSLMIDSGLLEQAVTNLLDNAGKYSFENTTVRITGGRTGSDGVQITIGNRGIPIYPKEADKTKERGWRSEYGQASRGSGSGIGLWVVDNIMKAHEGVLHVQPTENRWTEIRLLFPAARVIRRGGE